MAEYTHVKHTFEQVYDEYSRILILGSLPSVKSRENGFYYGHPRNNFWKVLASLLQCPVPTTIEEKKVLLLTNHIAIWDVIDECEIKASSDSSIRNPIPADIGRLLRESNIQKIYANGATAGKYYRKLVEPQTGVSVEVLLSTSPGNCRFSFEELAENWSVILQHIERESKIE